MSSNHKQRNAYYRALRKKSHPEADCIGEGAAPAPPHLNVAGAAWGFQSCGKGTISAAQYTTCKSPTLRCGGAGADPPASVPAPWYFFAVHGMHMSCLAHGSTAHPATPTARPQPGHSQVTVRSQSGHSQVTVRSWVFLGNLDMGTPVKSFSKLIKRSLLSARQAFLMKKKT